MGLITGILGAPVTGPAGGVFWVLRKIYDAAYTEFYDPASIKRQLVDLEKQLEAGELSEDEFEELEIVLLERLRDATQLEAGGSD